MVIMKFPLMVALLACAIFASFPAICPCEENLGPALQEKMLENAGKLSELIEANGGMPVPLLSNDELVILIKPMKEKLEKAGKKYTDLEIANMLGAIGVAEALRRNMAKAFSK